MSIVKATANSRWKGALLAAATAGAIAPVAAHAALVVNLSLSPLGGTAPKTLNYLTKDANSTDIPIYVYATVTGASAATTSTGTSATAPVTTGDFDGLQYLYYNILNSTTGASLVSGGIDTATGFAPTLNATLGFNGVGTGPEGAVAGNGAQVGTVQNVAGGVSVGANASSVVMTDYAKPRSPAAVFSNYASFNGSGYTYANDGTNIVVSGNTVSFLVETLYFKPTAYTASTAASKKSITFSAQVPTLTGYAGSNYFVDATSSGPATVTASGSSLAPFTQTSYTAGSSVTLTDTAAGDTNGDGQVGFADLSTVLQNYGATTPLQSRGNFDGTATIDFADLSTVLQNYGVSLGATPSIGADAALLADPAAVALLESDGITPTAVPEPASIGLAGIAALSILSRRKSK